MPSVKERQSLNQEVDVRDLESLSYLQIPGTCWQHGYLSRGVEDVLSSLLFLWLHTSLLQYITDLVLFRKRFLKVPAILSGCFLDS